MSQPARAAAPLTTLQGEPVDLQLQGGHILRMQARVRFEQVGGVLVAVHSPENPSDADWDAFAAFVGKHLQQTRQVFVYSAGGAPNVQQRRKLNALTQGRKTPGALVTASRVSRAVAVAVTWFHSEFRVFSPAELRAAFEFLRLDADEARAVLACLRALARQLNVAVPDAGVLDPAPR